MTISYELAKELKDAGFPQFGEGAALVLHQPLPESDQTISVISYRDFIRLTPTSHEWIYAPTLEELIEACEPDSKGGFKLWLNKYGIWKAGVASGTTPTEAVARLWLALNKK